MATQNPNEQSPDQIKAHAVEVAQGLFVDAESLQKGIDAANSYLPYQDKLETVERSDDGDKSKFVQGIGFNVPGIIRTTHHQAKQPPTVPEMRRAKAGMTPEQRQAQSALNAQRNQEIKDSNRSWFGKGGR